MSILGINDTYMIDEDVEAWLKYPDYRNWFNKLFVADFFGNKCGPASTPIPKDGWYIIRPTYNLAGMGAGAKISYYKKNNIPSIPAGYFWCEVYEGNHYSIDYERTGKYLVQTECFQGFNERENLTQFSKWIRTDKQYALPACLYSLDVEKLNIEIIGDKIIEVHFRGGFDNMKNYNELYPVFENIHYKGPKFLTWFPFEADGNGEIPNKRLGYYVR